jgi:hypothetical protein
MKILFKTFRCLNKPIQKEKRNKESEYWRYLALQLENAGSNESLLNYSLFKLLFEAQIALLILESAVMVI